MLKLRRVGIQIPHPIFYHYAWPGLVKPKRHQKITSAYLSYWRKALCTNGLGTGKTLAALWAADFLRQQGLIKKTLVICNKQAVTDVWGSELFLHLPKVTFALLIGSAERRLNSLARDVDIYIVNHHGMPIIHDALMQRNDIDLVIYDEATILRNCGEFYEQFQTWRTLREVHWIWPLTATPTPNLPTDAWALSNIIDSPRLTCDKKGFEDLTMHTISINGTNKKVPKKDAQVLVQDILFPAIRFSREQCVDMPPVTYIERKCHMSTRQQKAYQEMEAKFIYKYEQGEINAVNGAVQMGKLFQISSGFIYDTEEGEAIELDTKPKLDMMEEILLDTNEKVLIYANYVEATSIISKYLTERKIQHRVVHGGVGHTERGQRMLEFKTNPDIQCLVAQADTVAESLNFSMADVIIWFGPTLKNLIHEQANGRITREEQQRKKVVYYLAANSAELAQYRTLRKKASFQQTVNTLLQLRSAA